jgi:hypothetical protein
MSETQALEGLWASIGHAPWPVVIGYAIVALCIAWKGLTEGKLHGEVKAWAGATGGMLVGVGSAMALDGDWIHAVVFGVLVGGASTGFWSMVKQTIPDIGKPSNQPPPLTTTTTTTTPGAVPDNDRITPKETPIPRRSEEEKEKP